VVELSRDARFADVFVGVVEALQADDRFVDAMDLIVQACTDFTSSTQAAVIVAPDHGPLRAVASTHERTLDVEESQIGVDAGPCVDCLASAQTVQVDDVEAVRDRWPAFAETALSSGLASGVAVPIVVGGRGVAGINAFADTRGAFTPSDVSVVKALARLAATTLEHRRAADGNAVLAEQLTLALESRVVIEQAKGYLAYRHSTTPASAFGMLRNHARATRLPLRDVARGVVDRTLSL
jgi:GAF domain-containing protein